MPRRASRYNGLMIGPTEKVRTQSTRIDLRELQFFPVRNAQRQPGPGFVHGLPVSARRERNIVLVLITPFDLERGNTELEDFRNLPQRVQVFRRQQLVAALGRCRPRGEAGPLTSSDPGGVVAPAAAGAIDRAAFDRLTATMDTAFVAELIDTFLEDARELIASLRRALAGANRDAFRRAAHSLKSTSESLGAPDLATLARELENIGRSGVLSDVGDRIERLAAQYELVTRDLGTLRDGLAR